MQILELVERAKKLGPVDINGTLCHLTDTLSVSQSRLTVLVEAKPAGSDNWASYHVDFWPTWENGPSFNALPDYYKPLQVGALDALLDVEAYIGGMLKAS